MKKIYSDMDDENEDLFKRDEDEVFFRFLNVSIYEILEDFNKKRRGFGYANKRNKYFLTRSNKFFCRLGFAQIVQPFEA